MVIYSENLWAKTMGYIGLKLKIILWDILGKNFELYLEEIWDIFGEDFSLYWAKTIGYFMGYIR